MQTLIRHQFVTVGIAGLLLASVLAAPCAANITAPGGTTSETTEEKTAETPAEAEIPAAMRTPRAVVEAFVTLMRADKKKEATALLNLSEFSSAAAESRGNDLVFKLYTTLRRVVYLPPQKESGEEGDLTNRGSVSFTAIPEQVETSTWSIGEWEKAVLPEADEIILERSEKGRWQFSTETVASIDKLYEVTSQDDNLSDVSGGDEPTESISVKIENLFPATGPWRETRFLLKTYQWILLLIVLPILGRLVELITRYVLTRIGNLILIRYDSDFEEGREEVRGVTKPIGTLANATTWVIGADLIGLPLEVTNILSVVLRLVVFALAVVAIYKLLDLIAGFFTRRADRHERKFDGLVIPLATTTAKVTITLIAILAAIAVFNDELPTTLIGGLGIGGIAIALASQETLSNFIASVTLLFDRPFEVGDFVIVEGIEGEIESLGFRSTQIRTVLNSQVTLPNSKLATSIVDNWGRRKYRRYKTTLGLEYGTPPERIEAFCEGILELIRRQPHTRKDFYAAYFNDFGPSSLDILLICFFETPDYVTEQREKQRLLAGILRLAESVGVSFAFPTQTLHMHRGEAEQEPQPLGEETPQHFGAKSAAEIAGELPNYQDRPGKVKFPGPSKL